MLYIQLCESFSAIVFIHPTAIQIVCNLQTNLNYDYMSLSKFTFKQIQYAKNKNIGCLISCWFLGNRFLRKD